MKLNYKTTMSLAAAMGCLALTATSTHAALVNAGFNDDGTQVGDPTGWTLDGTFVGTRTTTSNLVPTEGTHMMWLNVGTLYQDTGIVIEAGSTYTLTVDLGVTTFPGHTGVFRLYGSGGDHNTALAGAETSVDVTGLNGAGTWDLDQTTSFVATGTEAGQTLGIALQTIGTQVEWDNVRLDIAPVPEPSSAALLGLGGLALILRRRK
ncbi:MAG TPA: hypothetical protein DHV60_09740 [Verrucomicrobiales bacterium]|nr:hypothetical protein [Verrucomicrobiales bacterium]